VHCRSRRERPLHRDGVHGHGRPADLRGGYQAMKRANGDGTSTAQDGPLTLAIDVGGTGLKASVLNQSGRMLVKRVRVPTPYPCRPEILLRAIAELASPLPPFDRISIGFPGVIRDGRVITAPHFDAKTWQDYALETAL